MLRSARNGWQLPRKEAETTRRARERTSPASVSTQWELFHAGVLFLRSWCISNHFSCRKPPYQNTVTSDSSFSNIWHCKAWNSSFCCLTLPGIDRQGILRCLPLLAETKDLLWWISHGPVQCVLSRACSSLRTNQVKRTKMTNEPIKEILGTPKHPEPVTTEKSNNNDCVITTIPLVSECQLTAATGGAELSCYRCTIPFGVVILIAGIVVTAVAYSFNSHGSIISVFGLVLLSSGLLLLASSAVCWKIRQQNKKAKRRESQTALVAHQRTLFG